MYAVHHWSANCWQFLGASRPAETAKYAVPGTSSDMDHSSGRLTVPKTPNLETRGRYRPNTAISQSDREAIELQEAKK